MAGTDLLNSVVICHPGSVTEEAVQAMKVRVPIVLFTFDAHVYVFLQVPSAWACAEGVYFFVSITGRI